MQKLKIGIFIDQLVPGGVQKSAINEARELKKLGHKVTIYVLVRLSYHYQYEDLTKGLKVIFLSDFNPWSIRRAIRIPYFGFLTHLHILNPFFVRRYKKLLKDLDFIVSHGTTTCITAAEITKKLKIPYMAFIYDPMLYILEKVYSKTPVRFFFFLIKPLTYYYERSFLTSASLVVTSSNVHREFIRNQYHIDPLIIRPGVSFLGKAKKKAKKPTILGFSRWQLAKNPELFLWLAKRLKRVSFVIAGYWPDSQEKAYFSKKIKKMGLSRRVKILSPVNEKDLVRLAEQSIAWVYPNFEAFGMAGLEMASLGLPIIMPEGSGVTELFRQDKHGFFPSAGDKKAYLAHIKYLINHPEKAKKMGLDAMRVAKNHNWENHTKKVLFEISSFLKKRRIVFLTNAFVATHSTGGGDHFVIELAKRVPKDVFLTVVTPLAGLHHWQKAKAFDPRNIKFVVLRPNPFDNIDEAIPLFFAYVTRAIQTHFILKKLPTFSLLHTATDILPDSFPAYFYKAQNPQTPWAARFFHFIEGPRKREGRLWVNLGSYTLQQFSLKFLKKADSVLIDNPTLEKDLVRKGFDKEKIKLRQGGIDVNKISKIYPEKKLSSTLVFVGRLIAHKGVFDAIDVLSLVKKKIPTVKLVMIGYGTKKTTNELKKKIKTKNLSKNVVFTGYLANKDLILKYMKSSKILLFLDHEAGFGLVVVEGMASGLPVIAYDLPIFGSTYRKGYLVANLRDNRKVAENIAELLRNYEKRETLSLQALKEAKKFEWDSMAMKFYDLLSAS